jgi:hypothetical protein
MPVPLAGGTLAGDRPEQQSLGACAPAGLLLRQLRLPGLVAEPIPNASALASALDRDGRTTIIVTHQRLPAGPTRGVFDAHVPGMVMVSLPSEIDGTLYVGDIGARIDPEQEADAAFARALVRLFRKGAPGRLIARSLVTGASGPTPGLGCSERVLERIRTGDLRLRQWGTRNVEYLAS